MRGGRFVDESDLRVLVDMFLRLPFLQGSLVRQDQSQVYRLRVGDQRPARTRLAHESSRPSRQPDAILREGNRGPGRTPPHVRSANRDRAGEIDFVTPVHPLARAADRVLGTGRRAAGRRLTGSRPISSPRAVHLRMRTVGDDRGPA